ncbi:alpha/beta hydrolase fold domain-containing protein [Streptomyces sp. Da 82-17]|uniref:alpha/beta hydrolase fold domain-containing protein n=1 Tax=Streptomyces sp. Da 82-17 TaxID=3377116 RepID=UPI0038D47C80
MTPDTAAVRERVPAPHPDAARLPPRAQVAGGASVLRGVSYAEVEGARPLELDLWLPAPAPPDEPPTGADMHPAPAGARPVPLVLYVHGGAWRRGRRDDLGPRTRDWEPGPFARIAAHGLAVACVDYRLSGEARFPAQLDDLRAALRWLTLRGPELGVDAERVVVWGESAGGHLASLLALTSTPPSQPSPAPPAPPAPQLAGAVVWYGPADLTTPRGSFDPADPATPEAALIGGPPARHPERAAEAGPLARVHGDAPPFLLLHGTHDTMVDPSHSEDLAARLQQAGAQAELGLIEGAEHGWIGLAEAAVDELFARSLAFASRCLRRAAHGRAEAGGRHAPGG